MHRKTLERVKDGESKRGGVKSKQERWTKPSREKLGLDLMAPALHAFIQSPEQKNCLSCTSLTAWGQFSKTLPSSSLLPKETLSQRTLPIDSQNSKGCHIHQKMVEQS